jgi:hypothetical protein
MKTTATIQPTLITGVALSILGLLILFAAVPFAFFMAVYFQSGWGILFGLVPFGIGIGSIRAARRKLNDAVRRQLSIISWILVIMLYSVGLFAQGTITPDQPWRLALMLPVFFGAVWMLIREISVIRAAKLVENECQSSSDELAGRSIEDRLDELERLKRRDMVTPEEYAAKRQEILKDL